MSDNGQPAPGLLDLLQQVLGRPSAKPEKAAKPVEEPTIQPPPMPTHEPVETAPAAEIVPGKQPKSADELAGIIMNALRTLDGIPPRGFVVTVYGGSHWNAMLTITPEASGKIDGPLWRDRVKAMAARLRQEYDLI